MKKSLKLLSLILILLTISFGWQKNVWAAKKTWGSYTAATKVAEGATQRSKTVVAKDTSDKFGVVLYISDMGYQNPLYYTHTIDGKPAFCLDAPLTSKSTMYAERFLFTDVTTLGPTTPGTHWDVADYALMYLLKDATIDSSDYVNRSLAIRGIAATFGMLDTPSTLKSKRKSGDLAKELLRACYNNVNNWLHYDASLRSTYEELNSLVGGLKTNAYGDQYKTCKSEDDYCWNDYVWVNASDHNQVVSGAKSYYASALTAALEYAKKAKNGGKMEVKAEPATSTGTKATPFEDSNGTMLFQRVEHKLTLKGLDPDNDKLKFALKDLTYDGGAKEYGASEEPSIVKIDVGGTAVCDKTASEPSSENCNSEWLGEDKNLLKAAGVTITEEMTITITIEFKGYKSLNDGVTLDKLLCDKQPMKYTLNYVYSAGDDSSSTNEFSDDIGIVWRSTDDTVGGAGDYESAKNSRQRFLTYHPDAKTDEDSDKDGEDYTGSLTGEINLTGDCAECEELAEDCVGGDTEACDDLKDAQKDGECPDCIVWEALCKISDDPENDENCKNFKDEDNGCCTDLVNECDEDPESDACDDLHIDSKRYGIKQI